MKFWNRLFRRRKKKKEELPDEADGAAYGLTEHETDLEDEQQRTGYVESLLTQIADAQKQIGECEAEYAMVDLYLKDMELIDYISGEDREKLEDCAKAVHLLEEDKSRYEKKKRHMSDADYAKMERLSEDAHDSLTRLQEAEQYQEAIRNDLSRLENEKQACLFRRQEAKTAMENLRGMAVITTAAVFFCIVILLIMQFAFEMQTQMGYILTAAVCAIALVAMYMKYMDAAQEDRLSSGSLNRVILLQNRVKIRYVNNTNLLDYILLHILHVVILFHQHKILLDYYYLKFGISSGEELKSLLEAYQAEQVERKKLEQTMQELSFGQEDLIRILKKYRLHDPMIWLHQTGAILDPKEMVEVRHAMILRRQQLRKQMEFNTDNAEKAQEQIKKLVTEYPKYAAQILKMVSAYEEKAES